MAFSILACESETDFKRSSEIQTYNSEGRFPNNPILAEFENGRLVFDTQEAFDQTIDTLKNLEQTELYNIFNDYYNLGFIPLYPYYTQQETERIEVFFQKRQVLLPEELLGLELEFEDILISDDLFASLLNYKREIIVAGDIYKYTFSGALIASEEDSLALTSYVDANNINDFIPAYNTLPIGRVSLTPYIDSYVSHRYAEPLTPCVPYHQYDPMDPEGLPPCPGYNVGAPPSISDDNWDSYHTDNLIDYIGELVPCVSSEAGFLGSNWTPFGVRRECLEYFGGDNRTQTLFYNESYLIYASIGVVAKHQEKGWLGGWHRENTEEVALVINQATFKIPHNEYQAQLPTIQIPLEPLDEAWIFFGGNLYTGNDFQNAVTWTPTPATPPSTPFNEEMVIQIFHDDFIFTQDIEITAEELNDLFTNTLYDQVKALFKSIKGKDPEKITMIVVDNPGTIIQYFDVSRRKKNENRINEILGYNWSVGFSFNAYLDGNNGIVSDPSQFLNANNYSIDIPDLLSYEDASLDFIGVTRRGVTWKGDQMIYNSHN